MTARLKTTFTMKIRSYIYVATIPMMIAFIAYVVFGYYFIIETSYPGISPAALWGSCIALGSMIYFFVVHLGHAFADLWMRRTGFLTTIGLFSITILASAYGVITASMLLFEGPVILRESLTTARSAILRLEAVAGSRLKVPELDEVQARVAAHRQTLYAEIRNPAWCGIGPKARDAIRELQRDLPGVKVLAGTDAIRNCSDRAYLDRLQAAYADLIEGALRDHPLQARFRMTERSEALFQARALARKDRDEIDAMLAKLSGVGNFVRNLELLREGTKVVNKTKSDYDGLHQKLTGLIGPIPDLPAQIEASALDQITSSFQLPNVLASRWNKITTVIYVAIALAMDVLTALMIAHSVAFDQSRSAARREFDDGRGFDLDGIRYIWSPVRHPAFQQPPPRQIRSRDP
ncbi:hypothetical protein [uncultured Methylobacterium sp.]|jgi:hypothetical protein|uniref:hypothetical protein n=1 Tax=uncultured Methylobacterium sp. TaxID=157278 RepID=UPI0026270A87|nr:hypothetical protein [uncultured Methylobacterium sp.]